MSQRLPASHYEPAATFGTDDWMVAVVERTRAAIAREVTGAGQASERLRAAMEYAAAPGGKLLRPILVFGAAAAAAGNDDGDHVVERFAAAIELVHVHSLIHDDLPCMDDDAWRRGRPSLHVAFDEATAILAGNALLVLAFQSLSDPAVPPDVASRAVHVLARGVGGNGVTAGQTLDLYWPAESPEQPADGASGRSRLSDVGAVQQVHQLKTAALMVAACELGAIAVRAPEQKTRQLCEFARRLGLAFQALDDLIDAVGDEATAGKRLRKDHSKARPSLPSKIGVRGTWKLVQQQIRLAESCLEPFAEHARPLRGIIRLLENKLAATWRDLAP